VEQPPLDLSKLPTDCLRLIAKFLQTPAAAAVSECTYKFLARTPIREAHMLRNSQGAFILSPLYHKRGSRERGVYCFLIYIDRDIILHKNQFTQACCNKRAFLIDARMKNNETIVKREKTKNLYARWLALAQTFSLTPCKYLGRKVLSLKEIYTHTHQLIKDAHALSSV
jgi:hypothetical protein